MRRSGGPRTKLGVALVLAHFSHAYPGYQGVPRGAMPAGFRSFGSTQRKRRLQTLLPGQRAPPLQLPTTGVVPGRRSVDESAPSRHRLRGTH